MVAFSSAWSPWPVSAKLSTWPRLMLLGDLLHNYHRPPHLHHHYMSFASPLPHRHHIIIRLRLDHQAKIQFGRVHSGLFSISTHLIIRWFCVEAKKMKIVTASASRSGNWKDNCKNRPQVSETSSQNQNNSDKRFLLLAFVLRQSLGKWGKNVTNRHRQIQIVVISRDRPTNRQCHALAL